VVLTAKDKSMNVLELPVSIRAELKLHLRERKGDTP
jgi:hypothetical protein